MKMSVNVEGELVLLETSVDSIPCVDVIDNGTGEVIATVPEMRDGRIIRDFILQNQHYQNGEADSAHYQMEI